MKRLTLYLAIGILFLFTTSPYTLAGMGGGGMGGMGGGMGGGMSGGGMGYGGQYGHQAPYSGNNRQQPRYNRDAMNRNTAEGLARNYIMGRYGDAYHLGDLKDHDTYYTAEIRGPRGNLTERLLIDKQSGNIHSLP